jgi:O-antigen/teichoic acid export membrane protein
MQHADRMKFKSQILEMFSTNAVTARVDGSKSRHVGGKEDSTRERGLTLIALVINQIVSALAGALVAAFLSPALFGAVHLSRTLVIFASTACSLGLDLGLQKQLSGRGSMPKKFAVVKAVRALAFGLSVLVIITSFVGGASFLEGKVFKHPDLAKALITTLLALPFLTDLTILGGAFRGLYRPLPSIVAQSLVQPVIRVLTIITCLVLGQEFLALPLAIVAGASLSWIILEIQSSQFFGSSKRIFATPLSAVREVLSYSTPLSLAIMTNMLTRMLDLLFIGYFRAPNELGKYSVVLLMTQMIGLAAVALGQTLGTRVAAAYIDADMQKIMKIQTAYMMQVAVISAPVFACLVFWGDRIDLLIGDSYRLDWRVVGVAASSAALMGMTNGLGYTLGMTGYQNRELGIAVAGFVTQAITCWALIPWLGQFGAALSSITTIVFIWLIRLWTIHRLFGIAPVTVSAFLPFILASVLAFGVYHAVTSTVSSTLVSTAAACSIVVTIYVASAMAWIRMSPKADQFRTE